MAERIAIEPSELNLNVVNTWKNDWFLLTAGDFEASEFNTMTVAWGSIGYMWNKPFAMVVVRPTRYTYEFIERFDTFTLCQFPADYLPALKMCGARSGRDTDKIAEAGLTPIAGKHVAAPGFAEASLIIECKKTYFGDIDPKQFLEPAIDSYYSNDYHRFYFGEIIYAEGIEMYQGR